MTRQKLRTALTAPVVMPLLFASLVLIGVAAMLIGLAALFEGTGLRRARPAVPDRPTPRARVRPPPSAVAGSEGPLQ